IAYASSMRPHPHWIDYSVIGIYFTFVLGIGFVLKKYMKTSTDFFLSGRSIPAWITGLAFLSANLGAQEVIGMGASGAKYGIATSHFYWVGAIPAMVFVGIFMGLGFVLSFGYWCTDFLVVQRAMAADSMTSARRTLLIAAFPKMLFPFLVILPGMIAGVVSAASMSGDVSAKAGSAVVSQRAASGGISLEGGKGIIPPKLDESGKPLIKDGKTVLDYDLATPMMLVRYFPSGLLGLGLCALMASFM